MIEAVRELLDKATQSIGAAELLMQDGYIDFSASRTYYAMFYAVEALLLSREHSFSKHSAVISPLGKEFVIPEYLTVAFTATSSTPLT